MFVLQTDIDPDLDHYEMTQELDGREFLIRLDWIDRNDGWTLSMYLTDGTPLATGRRLNVGAVLFIDEVDSRLPVGRLMLFDLTGSGVDPGHDELGRRCPLVYFGADEIAALVSS